MSRALEHPRLATAPDDPDLLDTAAAALAAGSCGPAGARRRGQGLRPGAAHGPPMEERATMQTIAIIGAGAWGTALAEILRATGRNVVIWAREAEVVDALNERHENTVFLPGIRLDPPLPAPERRR